MDPFFDPFDPLPAGSRNGTNSPSTPSSSRRGNYDVDLSDLLGPAITPSSSTLGVSMQPKPAHGSSSSLSLLDLPLEPTPVSTRGLAVSATTQSEGFARPPSTQHLRQQVHHQLLQQHGSLPPTSVSNGGSVADVQNSRPGTNGSAGGWADFSSLDSSPSMMRSSSAPIPSPEVISSVTYDACVKSIQVVFRLLERGDFRGALSAADETLHSLFEYSGRHFDASKIGQEVKTAVFYKIALRLLAATKEAEAVGDKIRAASLTRILAEVPIQAQHRVVCSRMCVNRNMEVGNYGVAARVIERLLGLKLIDADQLRQKLETCKRRDLRNLTLFDVTCPRCSYHGSFTDIVCSKCGGGYLFCYETFRPVESASALKCQYCNAIYRPDANQVGDVGSNCPTCHMGRGCLTTFVLDGGRSSSQPRPEVNVISSGSLLSAPAIAAPRAVQPALDLSGLLDVPLQSELGARSRSGSMSSASSDDESDSAPVISPPQPTQTADRAQSNAPPPRPAKSAGERSSTIPSFSLASMAGSRAIDLSEYDDTAARAELSARPPLPKKSSTPKRSTTSKKAPGTDLTKTKTTFPRKHSRPHVGDPTTSSSNILSVWQWSPEGNGQPFFPLEMPTEEVVRFSRLFDKADLDGDGYINGSDAKVWFNENTPHPATKEICPLPRKIMAQIWRLADVDTDGKLDREEFCLAMHLAHSHIRGNSLPPVLPLSLDPHRAPPRDRQNGDRPASPRSSKEQSFASRSSPANIPPSPSGDAVLTRAPTLGELPPTPAKRKTGSIATAADLQRAKPLPPPPKSAEGKTSSTSTSSSSDTPKPLPARPSKPRVRSEKDDKRRTAVEKSGVAADSQRKLEKKDLKSENVSKPPAPLVRRDSSDRVGALGFSAKVATARPRSGPRKNEQTTKTADPVLAPPTLVTPAMKTLELAELPQIKRRIREDNLPPAGSPEADHMLTDETDLGLIEDPNATWVRYETETGEFYFSNIDTQETVWELPAGTAFAVGDNELAYDGESAVNPLESVQLPTNAEIPSSSPPAVPSSSPPAVPERDPNMPPPEVLAPDSRKTRRTAKSRPTKLGTKTSSSASIDSVVASAPIQSPPDLVRFTVPSMHIAATTSSNAGDLACPDAAVLDSYMLDAQTFALNHSGAPREVLVCVAFLRSVFFSSLSAREAAQTASAQYLTEELLEQLPTDSLAAAIQSYGGLIDLWMCTATYFSPLDDASVDDDGSDFGVVYVPLNWARGSHQAKFWVSPSLSCVSEKCIVGVDFGRLVNESAWEEHQDDNFLKQSFIIAPPRIIGIPQNNSPESWIPDSSAELAGVILVHSYSEERAALADPRVPVGVRMFSGSKQAEQARVFHCTLSERVKVKQKKPSLRRRSPENTKAFVCANWNLVPSTTRYDPTACVREYWLEKEEGPSMPVCLLRTLAGDYVRELTKDVALTAKGIHDQDAEVGGRGPLRWFIETMDGSVEPLVDYNKQKRKDRRAPAEVCPPPRDALHHVVVAPLPIRTFSQRCASKTIKMQPSSAGYSERQRAVLTAQKSPPSHESCVGVTNSGRTFVCLVDPSAAAKQKRLDFTLEYDVELRPTVLQPLYMGMTFERMKQLHSPVDGISEQSLGALCKLELHAFTRPTPQLDFDSTSFQQWMVRNDLHRGIFGNKETDASFAERAYLAVVSFVSALDVPVTGEAPPKLRVSDVVQKQLGTSEDVCNLLVAVWRANGIPSRTVRGRKCGDNASGTGTQTSETGTHSVSQFFCSGVGWVICDPAPYTASCNDQFDAKRPDTILGGFARTRARFIALYADKEPICLPFIGPTVLPHPASFNLNFDAKVLASSWHVEARR